MNYSFDLKNQNILIASSIQKDMQGFSRRLQRSGFGKITITTGIEELSHRIRFSNEICDLVIIDGDLPGNIGQNFVSELRQGNIGKNPFLLIVVLVDSGSRSTESMVEVGVDDVLQYNTAEDIVAERITRLIDHRRPFLATSEYIGPDRRSMYRNDNKDEIKTFDVPNTFKKKALREDLRRIEEEINYVWKEISHERLVRSTFQLGFLVGILKPRLEKEIADAETMEILDRLIRHCDDALHRLQDTDRSTAGLAQKLHETLVDIRTYINSPDPKAVSLIDPLSKAIHKSISNEDEQTISGKIVSALDKFKKRKKLR